MTIENFILIFFITGSLISMARGFHLLSKSKLFIQNSIKTKATAIESVLKRGKSGVCFQVSYEFQDEEGNKIQSQFSSNKNIRTGEEIKILYSKSDPSDHKVDNFSSLYLMPIIFIFNGPLILIAAYSSIN